MTKQFTSFLAIGAVLALSNPALAASVMPIFTDEGIDTSGSAQQTRMFRADLTGLGLTEVGAVKLTDSNSGMGGSPGLYSGFDLDALFLDVDGLLTTSNDRFYASSFMYSAGDVRGGGSPVSSSGGPFNGASSSTTIDEAFATLNDIDALFFSTGSVTLGDGGSLTAIFNPKITIGSSLFLFAGEVSGSPGETLDGLIEVADEPPAVPLPAGGFLLLGGLGGLAALRRRTRRG